MLCGKIKKHIPLSNLKSGNTKTCGDRKKHKIQTTDLDLTNQTFGLLTALYPSDIKTSDGRKQWMCKCQCGNKILVRTSYLTSGHTQSCGCLLSKGENKIAFLLRENNIPFIQQKTFDTCRFNDTNYLAKFDFYVNNQYLIEYDGIQHFQNLYFSHAEKNKEHDEFKNQWCKENNIPLIRISYIHYDNLSIEDLLLNTTSFLI